MPGTLSRTGPAVELEVSDHELVLTVSDDGTGVPPDRAESGLRNARRREIWLA